MPKGRKKASSKKKSSSRGAAGDPSHLHGVWNAITTVAGVAYRNLTATVFCVSVIALLIGYAVGRDALERRVASARAEPIQVTFDWPTWMAGENATLDPGVNPMALLSELVQATVSMDPFDRASLVKAAELMRSTGWLQSDAEIRRLPGGTIRVSGTWRVPSAVVEYNGDSYLVGADGSPMRLPLDAEIGSHWYRVIGPSLAPRTRTLERQGIGKIDVIAWGEEWPGGDVQDGIALLRLLDASSELGGVTTAEGRLVDRIVAVDLSRYMRTASSELRLRTDLGGTIVWGAPIAQDAPGEVSVGVKIGHIAALLSRGERVDRPGVLLPVTGRVVTIDRVRTGRSSS